MKTKPKKTGKSFGRLNARQKRVAIAKDAIKQIEAEQVRMVRGNFITGLYWDSEINPELDSPAEFGKAQLNAETLTCQACAVGAAVVSGIRLFNRRRINRYGAHENAVTILGEWFSAVQVAMIETAYEHGHGWFSEHSSEATDEELRRARSFGRQFRSDHKRALAIFQNIVRHKGTFVP